MIVESEEDALAARPKCVVLASGKADRRMAALKLDYVITASTWGNSTCQCSHPHHC